MENSIFDFTKEPGKILKKEEYNNKETLISVIMPFYNDKLYIKQAVTSVLNQTFPCFELLIIDDGSQDEESLKELENVSKLDDRIKVFHKENGGLASARDFGAEKSSEISKYLFFLDSDDVIEKTYLECAYWTLETNKKAAWAYTDSVGYEALEYTWNKWFDSEEMKKTNNLVATALVRKKDFWDVNGYELREKSVSEDWNFWLKMIAKGKIPVRMNFYGFWYRRKRTSSELARAKANKKRTMEIIRNTAKTVKKRVKPIQYPKFDYKWEQIVEDVKGIPEIVEKDNSKTNILMIIPWMVMGGADKFNLELISRIDRNKFDITIVTTEPSVNTHRQSFEEFATVYDLTTFIDMKYWVSFINYIIKKKNINLIFNTNSEMGYNILPYLKAKNPEIPIIDYVHMEEWYNRNGGYSRDSSGVASVIDKTLVCNENSREVLINHFKRNEKEIETVYIGVDEKIYNPEKYNKKQLKEKYKLPKNKYIISYICRISEQKRPFLLLKIIEKLKNTRSDFIFLIVGDGNLLNEMKAKAKSLGISDNINFLGRTSKTDEIYAISDMTINCSIKEGLALTAYESLAMGVPVVSSDVGGQKELIDSKTGIIVPCIQKEEDILEFDYSEDEIQNYVVAINKILDNLEKYQKECRQKILNGFTVSQMVDNMTKIIKNVAENPNPNKKIFEGNIDITKELITNKILSGEDKYNWEVKEYNSHYGFKQDDYKNYKFEMFKSKMWQHKWYRGMIKTLKKLGIIDFVKGIR